LLDQYGEVPVLKSILQGRFMNHPLHPILTHFPIGFWVGSFLFDLMFFGTGKAIFATASYYCILFGLIGAAFAVPAGYSDYLEIPANSVPKRIASVHLILNVVVTLFYIANIYSRFKIENTVPTFITRGEFILSIFSLLLLGISGYLGGMLIYAYGIGYKPQLRDRKHPEEPDIRRVA
jgi:uncharacterized membrane protein